MSKEIYISSTPHETRLAIVENDVLTEIYYERENEYTLAGSIYNGKVTRVLPGMQSSFVDIGLERDAFLYITDFMEEAPDSAEFDTASLGDGGSRAPRLEASASVDSPSEQGEGQRSEAPRGDGQRRERSGGGRNDRNGRGRRGRGDRPANADRPAQTDQTSAPETYARESEAPRFEAPHMETPASIAPSFDESADVSQIGEGAPGADGSRRWRGRRGRRRGRGPGAGREDLPLGTTQNDAVSIEPADTRTGTFENAAERFPAVEPSFQAPPSVERTAEAPAESYNEARSGDRGGRDRNRGREDRGGRGERAGRGERKDRAPRGFEPSRGAYGVETSYDQGASEAPAEPIILPGESLGKYRAGGEILPTQPTADNLIVLAPSGGFAIPGGWDGGATLPGESLSRHRRSEGRSDEKRNRSTEAAAEHRTDTTTPLLNRSLPLHEEPAQAVEPVATHADVIHEQDGVSVASTPEQQPEVASAAHPEAVPEAEVQHEAVPEPVQAPVEYEPLEASASYRVDPVPPSEFRQSAPVEEAAEETVEETASNEIAPVEPAFGHTHTFTPEPVAPPVEERFAAPIERTEHQAPYVMEEAVQHFEPITGTPLPTQDITVLHASGEMISELPAIEPSELPAPQEVHEPTSPILHETAVSLHANDFIEEPVSFDEIDEAETQSFAPGSGELEEELLDDDEDEVTSMHAGYADEADDLEEETLEGAADLGTMIREMSIDQITRSAPAEEDEDEEDFEEDFLEESEEIDPNAHEFEEAEEGSEEYARTAEAAGDFSSEFREPETREAGEAPLTEGSFNERRGGRRDARRGGRDRDPRRGGDSSGRPRNMGGSGDRDRGRTPGRTGRSSMQSTNLPAISELLKPGQEILVQIAKEPIAKKGARITSHIALPGRFLVFMPTVNHTGVSRKIESDGERRRLKEILLSEKGEAAGGFIVRTAASGASEEELRSDLRFLLNLWTDIKNRSESSKSPALIYHDLNLVERILRDQVTDNFSAIWVDTETEYERVLRFLQRFQPSLIRRVKLYLKETPLFEQFGITEEINKALRSKVWLKSGGSIVINQTEALVAIDINTGKFVGKTARLEDTIVKTNLDAIPEIVRQIRLRDLGGIIIIDFIDMDERKNRNKVMAALEEELKSDRAPSKVLQFNDFGLVAITRKRVKQSLERTLSTTCGVCQGTGMVKSPVTVCNDIYVEMRKMFKHLDKGDVMLRVHPDVVKQLKSPGTRWLQEMEEMSGKTILVKSDPSLHPEQFDIH